MTIGIIGMGSIGRRHAQQLRELGVDSVVALRTHLGSTGSLGEAFNFVEEVSELKCLLESNLRGVLICNPTSLHAASALPFLERRIPVFIEKPVASVVADARPLDPYADLIVVGYCLRFHPMYQILRKEISERRIGKLWRATFKRSFYLPFWHPTADYRHEYSARRDLGGGVIRTLSHGIDMMHYLFGPAREVSGLTDRLSDMDLDVDDFARFSCKLESGGRINFDWDFFSPVSVDEGDVVGDRGRFVFDMNDWEFQSLDGSESRKGTVSDGFATMYRDQMADFLGFVDGAPTRNCRLEDASRVLEIIEEVESQ